MDHSQGHPKAVSAESLPTLGTKLSLPDLLNRIAECISIFNFTYELRFSFDV